jgi:hypothetical protein
MTLAEPDPDLVRATTELAERCGARMFEFGHLRDNVPSEQAGWWAKARFAGAVIMVDNQPSPDSALTGLAEKLLTGAQCQRCGGLVALSDDGAMAYPDSVRPDGTRWTREEIEAAGLCRWRREGAHWKFGCVRPPEGNDEVHTTEKLARALEETNDPRVKPLVWRARRGYYHDFLSPLPFPEMQLVDDLRELGMDEFAQRVVNDEFTSTLAESRAWGRSEDGQEAFESLVGGGRRSTGEPPAAKAPSGAAFWAAQGGRPSDATR